MLPSPAKLPLSAVLITCNAAASLEQCLASLDFVDEILVVDSGSTKIGNAQAALKRLLVARAHVIGVLLTKYNPKTAGHGYHYESYYAYGGPARLPGKSR